MGAVDHGTQSITYQYFLEATGANFGKRLLNVLPPGIYSGGYLTRVSDSEVTLSTLVAEIRDTTNQVNVRTAVAATLKAATLDSGTISSGTPYLVMRWAYAESASNYLEIHAIATAAAALTNDVIIGKCVFSGSTLTGFDYTDRTFLNVQDLFLKVEASSGLYVRIRAGRIHTTSGYVVVPNQSVGPFSVPTGGNSRIDLVYVAADGTVAIEAGSQAVSPSAPSYDGKLVVAEVRLVNGDSSIPADRISDVRSFLVSTQGFTVIPSRITNIFGNWAVKSNATTYLAATDGLVQAFGTHTVTQFSDAIRGYTDASNPPTTERGRGWSSYGNGGANTITMPVKKGHYWKVTGATTVSWLPIGV